MRDGERQSLWTNYLLPFLALSLLSSLLSTFLSLSCLVLSPEAITQGCFCDDTLWERSKWFTCSFTLSFFLSVLCSRKNLRVQKSYATTSHFVHHLECYDSLSPLSLSLSPSLIQKDEKKRGEKDSEEKQGKIDSNHLFPEEKQGKRQWTKITLSAHLFIRWTQPERKERERKWEENKKRERN